MDSEYQKCNLNPSESIWIQVDSDGFLRFNFSFFQILQCQNVSRDISTKKIPQRNSQKKTYLPNELWREISSNKSLKWKYLPKNFWRTFSTKKSLQRNPYPKSQKSDWATLEPKKLWRGISSKRSLKIKFWRKKQWREITSQKSLQKNPYQKSLKRHSLPKDWKEGSLLQNHWFFLRKSLETISLRRTVWREICAKQIPTQTSTNKVRDEICLPEIIWREVSTKHLSKETPSKKNMKNIYQKHVWREISI